MFKLTEGECKMYGKLHPYWYLNTTSFPYTHAIRLYQSDWGWWYSIETDNEDVIPPSGFVGCNSNVTLPITFNTKVSQFTLIEKVYTTYTPTNDDQFVFERKNTINCYYPDDFDVATKLSPADGSLTANDLDNLFTYDGAGTPSVSSGTFNYYNKLYIGRKYNYGWAWKMEVNPHTLAEAKGITDYDFALMKYVYWDNGGHKAVVSDRDYYPIGWFDGQREYWTLFKKDENERLYCVRRGGYYGVGISEIQYLKLKV